MTGLSGYKGALTGIRVVDFSRIVAGPHCTMCLADLGAEVIKVEDTGHGDDIRHHKPPEIKCDSPYFLSLNRNKSSIGIDFTSKDGKDVVHDLIATADILVENFRTGVMKRHGLGYGLLKKSYPNLIYCSISGYGRTGSQATRAAYDPVVQAESGLMATNGSSESGPMRTGLAVTDMQTGLYAAQSILAALFARERGGSGQHIEIALYDVAVSSLSHYGIRCLMDGTELPRVGNGSNAAQPIGVFPARDGKLIQVTCASERSFVQFVEAVDRPELAQDPRFSTNPKRLKNKDALLELIAQILATDDRDAWIEKLHANGAPAGAINELNDALTNDFIKERGITESLPHPLVDSVPNLKSPVRMSETPVRAATAAPMHAQHTADILSSVLGYDLTRIETLRKGGAVK